VLLLLVMPARQVRLGVLCGTVPSRRVSKRCLMGRLRLLRCLLLEVSLLMDMM
jgi:hypothetical protein